MESFDDGIISRCFRPGEKRILGVAGLTIVPSGFVVLMRLPSLNMFMAIHTFSFHFLGIVGEGMLLAVDVLCVGENHR